MVYLFLSLMFFFSSVAAHVFWCRLRNVRTIAVAAFCRISFVFFVAYVFFLGLWPGLQGPQAGLWGRPLQITSVVLYVSMVPFYFVFYHMIIINSPTRLMLDICRKKGSCSYEDLAAAVEQEDFIKSRLTALVCSGVIIQEGTFYRLSRQGVSIAKGLEVYQALVGRSKGG